MLEFKVIGNAMFPLNNSTSEKLAEKSGEVVLISNLECQRTLRQNKYLYVIFNLLSEATGYTVNEIKNLVLIKTNHYEVLKLRSTSERYIIPVSTRALSRKQFSELTKDVIKYAGETLGIEVMTSEDYFKTYYKSKGI